MKHSKVKINWNYIGYLVRKLISKFGWICCGCYLTCMIEFAVDKWTVSGLILALAVAILANIDNEKPTKD